METEREKSNIRLGKGVQKARPFRAGGERDAEVHFGLGNHPPASPFSTDFS